MNLIFEIGVLLIPFDNLVIAPSAGWASISPIIFLIYVLTNIKILKESIQRLKKPLIFIFIAIFISAINYFRYQPYLSNIFNSISTIITGIAFLISLDIYLNTKKCKINKLLKLLFVGYFLSLLIGLIQFVALKFNFEFLLNTLRLIEKRQHNRVQFSFTEPSFIAMHLYGVILPILIFVKNKEKEYKNLKKLFAVFCIISLLVNSSTRFAFDSILIIIIYLITKIDIFKAKNIVIIIASGIIMITLVMYFYNYNPRFKMVIDQGVYSDASSASRYFRVNASIYGYQKEPISAITGYGISNAFYPMELGFYEAFADYKNPYVKEVLALLSSKESQLFNFHSRLISEIGLILTIIIYVYLFNKKHIFILLTIAYLYMQFDSYAFYALWIYIFFTKYYIYNENEIQN